MCVHKNIYFYKKLIFSISSEIHLRTDSVKNLVSAQRIMKFLLSTYEVVSLIFWSGMSGLFQRMEDQLYCLYGFSISISAACNYFFFRELIWVLNVISVIISIS